MRLMSRDLFKLDKFVIFEESRRPYYLIGIVEPEKGL